MSIFLSYEGVRGESSDKGHNAWMDIDNLRWGVKRNITSHTSTRNDRESANAEITDLVLERRMDSATPPRLFTETCCGTGKTVVIHLTTTGAGAGSDVFMEYTLKNALVSNYMIYASAQAPAGHWSQ